MALGENQLPNLTRLFAVLGSLLPLAGFADEPPASDDPDAAFDTSDFLLNRQGVFPVPMVITEPAVGYGGGLMLLYFSEPSKDQGDPPSNGHGKAPPNVTGAGALLTENGSRGGALFHFHTWQGDKYRYLGALAHGRVNLDYYGPLNQGRGYQLKGTMLIQQLLARVGDSRWYVGPRYSYFGSDARFRGEVPGELGSAELGERIGKLGAVVQYDSRDNIFYPTRGHYAEFSAQLARRWTGSDRDFETYSARSYTWTPIAPKWTLGFRVDGQFTDGAVPFYAQPYVDLRGVSRGRYQDRNALVRVGVHGGGQGLRRLAVVFRGVERGQRGYGFSIPGCPETRAGRRYRRGA